MRKKQGLTRLIFLIIVFSAIFASAQNKNSAARQNRTNATGRTAAPRGPQGVFLTDVPAQMLDIILVRPTATSVTVSILCYENAKAYVAYGITKDTLASRTESIDLIKGRPHEIILENLKPDTQYYYHLCDSATNVALPDSDGKFHTQRMPGSTFLFTVQADSHLDENANPEIYRQTLINALADSPDFHVDLGDTFMNDKHSSRESAAKQYLAQRYYFGLIGRSSSVFLVLGNHDGEDAKLLKGGAGALAVWSNSRRKLYFPNPVPDGFYSGNSARDSFCGLLQDYYAWEWGDALFIVLNPYWYSSGNKDNNWNMTLGKEQYIWLKNTLERSKTRFKFVFIHQLVGGLGKDGRGGTEAAKFFEWGGKNTDGSDGFKENRPGWEMPIHQLLIRNHVTIVFHGHDHFFARQNLDDIVYQLVPQPGFKGNDYPKQAAEYGYTDGVILGGSGHLRITVSPEKITVDYMKSLPSSPVVYSYTITANQSNAVVQNLTQQIKR